MGKNLVKQKYKLDTSKLFEETFNSLAQGIIGLAASDRKDMILSLGYIFQRTRSMGFLGALRKEWDFYREKGRIKDDYMESEQHKECLQEMLDFLDKDSPDQLRFRFLKAIFLGAATETEADRESVLPQQYMSLFRTLSSGEVLVLHATYSIVQEKKNISTSVAVEWLRMIAKKSGLKSEELVAIHEQKLMEKNLLTKRLASDNSGVIGGTELRLTPLAMDLCEFINEFDEEFFNG